MPKITNTWTLPAPPEGEVYEWYPVVRVGRIIPFGYRQDPTDCDILLPIAEELDLFEEAKKYLKQYSYRDVAAWLSEESGRYLSHVGLMKRVKLESKRKKEASNQRQLAKKYKEALHKAEKLEGKRLGGRNLKSTDSATESREAV